MQTQIGIGGVATALVAVLWCQAGLAQGPCGDIQFSSDITSRFPNARNACLGVVRRDGQEFAHFQGRIRQVRGNTVEAEFKQPNGEWGRPVSFEADANARVRIQGQTYRYRDLVRGQELDVYLPADRWAIAVAQDPSTDFQNAPGPVTLVALQEPAPSVASAALPRTASILPLLGLLGALLTGLGAAVATVRRKL